MKWLQKHKGIIVEVICFLFILLFVYAAVSKLTDFGKFKAQLGQSPMLTAFSGWIAWGIPILELLVVGLLFLLRYKLLALYACFFLMTIFTFYILIILNFSPYVPCSCGGILESMGWTTHLIFNIVFILLAFIGILLQTSVNGKDRPILKKIVFTTSSLVLGATVIVIGLYGVSDSMIHSRNNFLRIFPPHPIMQKASIPLNYNSYYLAGTTDHEIFLGNATAPLHMIVIDSTFKGARVHNLTIKNVEKYSLKSSHVKVLDSMVYLFDGNVPIIFSGNVHIGKLTPMLSGIAYFNMSEPAFQGNFAIRSFQAATKENSLGLIDPLTRQVRFYPEILKKQMDGIFSTDGAMHYNQKLHKLIYTYYYRNEYLVLDSTMKIYHKGNTIDTNTIAKIGTTTLIGTGIHQMTAPPMIVNKGFHSFGNYLFVHSALLATNEDKNEFLEASVIDVYSLDKGLYEFSFYIPDFKDGKVKGFRITKDKVIALYNRDVVIYELGKRYFKD